jgi:YihY family inner membrane protein
MSTTPIASESGPGGVFGLPAPAPAPAARDRTPPVQEAKPTPKASAAKPAAKRAEAAAGGWPKPPREPAPEPEEPQGGGQEDIAWAGVAAAAGRRRSGSGSPAEQSRPCGNAEEPWPRPVAASRTSAVPARLWERAYRETSRAFGDGRLQPRPGAFPFALLVLFIFGQVIKNPDVEASVLRDLQSIFPAAEQSSLTSVVDRIRDSSATIGLVAAVGAIWIGASFWGAMDTAFCRIYHVECRGWVSRSFALVMLVVVIIFLAASVAIPVAEGVLAWSRQPAAGPRPDRGLRSAIVLGALAVTFVIVALIYYAVPKGHVPWRGVWPGALFVTVTTAIANGIFPVYLGQSSVDQIGGALGFILVALVWFYSVSLALLAGAVINALRFELGETGSVEEERARAFADLDA